MSRFLPKVHLCRWGGADVTGDGECDGWALAFQWFGLIIELSGGVVR